MEFLKLADGRGHFYKQNNALCVKFLYTKIMHFPLRFYIQKVRHFLSHFYMQKTMQFALRFISKINGKL